MNFHNYLAEYSDKIGKALVGYLPDENVPHGEVIKAMRYSLLCGGKRIRPVLVLEFCRVCGHPVEKALPFACAIEMIHTYSLIHDDLPCMDNDDMRRGKPSNHIAFGEDIALLAGDALLNLAFETMSCACTDKNGIAAMRAVSSASGTSGMIGGQVIDIENDASPVSRERLELIHSMKTGALIRASCEAGAILGGGNASQVSAAVSYAENLGMAFQIIDDILDVTGDEKVLGKRTGNDAQNNKTTFVTLLGIEAAKKLAVEYTSLAKKALGNFENDTTFLSELADYLTDREK